MVLHKQGEKLYKGVNQLVAENLDKLAKEIVVPAFPTGGSDDPMQQSQEGEMLLKALRHIWDDHTSNMTKLGQILKYMVHLHPFGYQGNSFFIGSSLYEICGSPTNMGGGP
jgi:cullin 3